jgi:hypothetical protein
MTLHVDVGDSALFDDTALKTMINNIKNLKLRGKNSFSILNKYVF